MNQPVFPQDVPRPDDIYPTPFPHLHPRPVTVEAGGAMSTPTPTPSPPPPSSSSASTIYPVHPASSASSPQLLSRHQSLLRAAVQNGDSSGLLRLLEAREGKVNLNVLDADGQTVLHHSCRRGDLQLVKVLVRFGADVRLANRDGWTAVHIAAFGGHTDLLLYLMTASTVACSRS